MSTIGWIIVASVGGLVVMSLVFRVVARAAAASIRANIAGRFPADAIVMQDDLANHFGRTSKGPVQVRGGSGGLVLTRDALHFLPIVGDEVTIPLSEISGVATVKSHLGKTVGRPLLKVEFGGDSIAFFVNDVEAWKRHLAQPAA
jgi:hypothetical protein